MSDAEQIIKSEITVKVGEEEFTFKIPSMQDRIKISAYAVKLRRDADPDGNVTALGYDPSVVTQTEYLATFIKLIKSSTAKWVYSPDAHGQPSINLDNWPDTAPVMEVVDQFNKELATFRSATS